MSVDSFTEYTPTSFGKRLGNSIKGVLFGVVMFFGSFPLLFWNEGRAIKTHQALLEGQGQVVSVPPDAARENEGRLVHMSGEATTEETLSDEQFAVSERAIKLVRSVDMYQWDEDKETRNDKTTYKYSKVWSSDTIDSSGFRQGGHENPRSKKFGDFLATAKTVTLGVHKLSESLLMRMDNWTQIPVGEADMAKLAEDVRSQVKPYGGGYYVGADPSSPQIGDLQITFKAIKPAIVSIVSMKAGESFAPWHSSNGREIEMLEMGTVAANEMFAHAITANKIQTWLLRGAGWFIMFLGMTLVLKPLTAVGGAVPILGRLFEGGVTIICAFIAAALSLITIAIGWLVYRPLIGIALLAAALVPIVALKMIKGKKADRPFAPPPPPPPPPIPPPIPS